MRKISQRVGSVIILLIAAHRAHAAVGETIGWGWDYNFCTTTLGAADADGDGLNDWCENALAAAFSPWLIFDEEESTSGQMAHYAVRKGTPAECTVNGYAPQNCVVIFYAMSYFADGGLYGFTDHDGDGEMVLEKLNWDPYDKAWLLDWTFLSAHGYTSPYSAWVPYDQIGYQGNVWGHPTVHVSQNKHANYKSKDACENACFGWWVFQVCEDCDEGVQKRLDIGWGGVRNVGSSAHPLANEVWLNGQVEAYWYRTYTQAGTNGYSTVWYDTSWPTYFCGWRPVSDRTQCGGGYRGKLVAFGF
jgi:hypothetical protein